MRMILIGPIEDGLTHGGELNEDDPHPPSSFPILIAYGIILGFPGTHPGRGGSLQRPRPGEKTFSVATHAHSRLGRASAASAKPMRMGFPS